MKEQKFIELVAAHNHTTYSFSGIENVSISGNELYVVVNGVGYGQSTLAITMPLNTLSYKQLKAVLNKYNQ